MDVFSERGSRKMQIACKSAHEIWNKAHHPSVCSIFSFAHFLCYTIIINNQSNGYFCIYVRMESVVESPVPKDNGIEYASIPRNLIDCRKFCYTNSSHISPTSPRSNQRNQPYFLPMELNHQRKQVSAKLIALLSQFDIFVNELIYFRGLLFMD